MLCASCWRGLLHMHCRRRGRISWEAKGSTVTNSISETLSPEIRNFHVKNYSITRKAPAIFASVPFIPLQYWYSQDSEADHETAINSRAGCAVPKNITRNTTRCHCDHLADWLNQCTSAEPKLPSCMTGTLTLRWLQRPLRPLRCTRTFLLLTLSYSIHLSKRHRAEFLEDPKLMLSLLIDSQRANRQNKMVFEKKCVGSLQSCIFRCGWYLICL